MSTLYYRTIDNKYIGAFEGDTGKVPADAIEVPFPPKDARFEWDGSTWNEPAALKDVLADEKVELQVIKQGITTEDKVLALWALAKGDKTQFDAIESIIAQAVIDNPK